MRRVQLWRTLDGHTEFTPDAYAIVVGITTDQLLEVWNPAGGDAALPPDLQRQGRQRTRKACADTGATNATLWAVYDE